MWIAAKSLKSRFHARTWESVLWCDLANTALPTNVAFERLEHIKRWMKEVGREMTEEDAV